MAHSSRAGFLVYESATEKDRHLAEQKRLIADLELRLDRSWAEELVADVRVDALTRDPDGGQSETTVTFVQYAPGTEMPVVAPWPIRRRHAAAR